MKNELIHPVSGGVFHPSPARPETLLSAALGVFGLAFLPGHPAIDWAPSMSVFIDHRPT